MQGGVRPASRGKDFDFKSKDAGFNRRPLSASAAVTTSIATDSILAAAEPTAANSAAAVGGGVEKEAGGAQLSVQPGRRAVKIGHTYVFMSVFKTSADGGLLLEGGLEDLGRGRVVGGLISQKRDKDTSKQLRSRCKLVGRVAPKRICGGHEPR